MKTWLTFAALLFALVESPAFTGELASLFDGKSLDGWSVRGGKAVYTVAEGCIVGTTV